MNPYGGSVNEGSVDEIPDRSDGGWRFRPRGGWTLTHLLDLAAAIIIVVVVFRAVGAVISAANTPTVTFTGSDILGSGGTTIVPNVSTYERLQYATGWADVPTAILLLLALLAVGVPRVVWTDTDDPSSDRRGRGLLVGIATVAVLTMAAAGVAIYNLIEYPGLGSAFNENLEEAAPVALVVGALILAAMTAAGCWIVRRFWGTSDVAITADHGVGN